MTDLPPDRPAPPNSAAGTAESQYFRFVRREILPLLPATATRILDVGAGVGATSAWLSTRYEGCTTVALEGSRAVEPVLRGNVDEVHIVDLNGPLPDVGAPDLVLLLDVLEHLVDPWDVLQRIVNIAAPQATVIVSVPNIAHLSVSLPLLVRGTFDYRDAGILDRTHLRFFVRASAIALLNSAGLRVEKGVRTGFGGPRARLLERLTMGGLRDGLTKQYILAGHRLDPRGQQGRIEWALS